MDTTTAGITMTQVREPGVSNSMWSVEELIAYLGVSYETFRTWRKHGRGPANEYKFGKVLRFAERDVAEWIAGGCTVPLPRHEPASVIATYGW